MEQAAADHVSASRQPGLVLQQSLRPWDSDWGCVRMWVMSDGGAVCAAVWWLLTGCVCVCGERCVVYMWWLDMIVCLCDEWCVVCACGYRFHIFISNNFFLKFCVAQSEFWIGSGWINSWLRGSSASQTRIFSDRIRLFATPTKYGLSTTSN